MLKTHVVESEVPNRIAHVISARGVGGAERFLHALTREGETRGWEQLVLNPFANDRSGQFADLVGPVRYKPRSCDSLKCLPATRRWLKSELSHFNPVLVHVVLFHAGVTTATIRRNNARIRIVTNVYGQGVRFLPHAAIMELLDRWAGRRYDRTVAISESVRRFLVSEYRYPVSKVSCIPLGWEGHPLPHIGDDHPPTVICIANFRREKGHDMLLHAFERVAHKLPNARLLLVGQGPLEASLRRLVVERGLPDHVKFCGPVANVWPYLARADVFATASHTEAFGVAVAEAMAAGLPIVAPEVGGLAEQVEAGISGELFARGDEEALAGHLLTLLISPELRQRMGDAAREAAQRFTMRKSANRYADLFEEMIQSSTAAGTVREENVTRPWE